MAAIDCPYCSNPITWSDDCAGKRVLCPHCRQSFVMPGRLPPAPPLLPSQPPPLPGRQQDYRDIDYGITLRTRNCTLAYVSLFLVCVSFLTGFVLLLPGMVCGHIALYQCARDPSMTGKSYAVAALSIGYIIIAVVVLISAAIVSST